ncbi:hypothetical protein F5X96DRAFT_674080 [Biscogniauxia mediterranea]|nr:hypothetical protein F5X96DRAFT_674080 [Biscogniauxia mediterranea]
MMDAGAVVGAILAPAGIIIIVIVIFTNCRPGRGDEEGVRRFSNLSRITEE